MEYYILDADNTPRPVEVMEYHRWKESLPKNIQTGIGFTLARDSGEKYEVSTVYLGMDHRMYGEPEPVLWETMVFGEDGSTYDEYCERYSSREEALKGHCRIVTDLIGPTRR